MTEPEFRVENPFKHSAVTSSVAVAKGSVDLKVAASFYDTITIFDHDEFDSDLPGVLGPDYDFLCENGIIKIERFTNWFGLKEGEKGYQYANSIQSHLLASIFSTNERRPRLYEVIGNGIARLSAALAQGTSCDGYITPIVTGRTVLPGFSEKISLDKAPVPSDEYLKGSTPNRAIATQAIFKKVPVPDRGVPWQDILDLRAEENTGLYAARLRLLLSDLGKEQDRRVIEDRILSDFASFEARLRTFKMKKRWAPVRMTLPWLDLLHGLVKGIATVKLSEAVKPVIEFKERQIEMLEAEEKISSDPLYMIEHVRSHLV